MMIDKHVGGMNIENSRLNLMGHKDKQGLWFCQMKIIKRTKGVKCTDKFLIQT
ncbi:hypothetical protein [Arcicella aurantiaca]|uniref:hypothetical protein n=1 Tax=Arcicella aurantiaca TaxID=591202 RepID=UPI001304FE58|nr:hypothetical protein [Arcicella aurantiaca]